MDKVGLTKLLNTSLKKRFPNIIEEIIVIEEELEPSILYYNHVYVILKNYDDLLMYSDDIKSYIKDISNYVLKYGGKVINQISFSMDTQ